MKWLDRLKKKIRRMIFEHKIKRKIKNDVKELGKYVVLSDIVKLENKYILLIYEQLKLEKECLDKTAHDIQKYIWHDIAKDIL